MGKYRFDYSEWVDIRGSRQNIRVRSQNEENPVILFLHGGPGVCDRHWVLENQSALAESFTMVMWDQRGSGKSFTRDIYKGGLHISDYIDDAEELARFLCRKFGREKIIIACHSWGTIIGTPLAARSPELFSAYIGQGQFVNGPLNETLSYKFCMEEAIRRGDKKAERLLGEGVPENGIYPSHKAMMNQRNYLTRYGGENFSERSSMTGMLLKGLIKSPEYSLGDIVKYAKGGLYLSDVLWPEVIACRFDETVKELKMPVLLTIGRHDYNTPFQIAYDWFEELSAPHKEWVWFENSAHSPINEEPEKWTETVRAFCLNAAV